MKRLVHLALTLSLLASLTACGGGTELEDVQPTQQPTPRVDCTAKPEQCT